jgi:hypothetical protein
VEDIKDDDTVAVKVQLMEVMEQVQRLKRELGSVSNVPARKDRSEAQFYSQQMQGDPLRKGLVDLLQKGSPYIPTDKLRATTLKRVMTRASEATGARPKVLTLDGNNNVVSSEAKVPITSAGELYSKH